MSDTRDWEEQHGELPVEVVQGNLERDKQVKAFAAGSVGANLHSENGRPHQSDSIGKLVEALAKAQLEFAPILKESENPAFARGNRKAKYASLDAVINATRPAMAKHGLALVQFPTVNYEGKKLTLVSKLAHSSGEWMENELVMPAANTQQGFTVQTVGSAITYARRYAWQAITGCVGEEDDDGNQAAEIGSAEAAKAVAERKTKEAGVVPALFFTPNTDGETYTVTGIQVLLESQRDVLKKHWNKASGAIIVNGEELEGLKYTFEQREVPFKLLKDK